MIVVHSIDLYSATTKMKMFSSRTRRKNNKFSQLIKNTFIIQYAILNEICSKNLIYNTKKNICAEIQK